MKCKCKQRITFWHYKLCVGRALENMNHKISRKTRLPRQYYMPWYQATKKHTVWVTFKQVIVITTLMTKCNDKTWLITAIFINARKVEGTSFFFSIKPNCVIEGPLPSLFTIALLQNNARAPNPDHWRFQLDSVHVDILRLLFSRTFERTLVFAGKASNETWSHDPPSGIFACHCVWHHRFDGRFASFA